MGILSGIRNLFGKKCPHCSHVVERIRRTVAGHRSRPETQYQWKTETYYDPISGTTQTRSNMVPEIVTHIDTVYKDDFACPYCGHRWSETRTVYG